MTFLPQVNRLWRSLFLIISMIFLTPTPVTAQTVVSVGACNATNFAQIPGNTSQLIGRHLINTTSDGCSGNNWKISLYNVNWTTNSITYSNDLITLPVSVAQGDTIVSAYDPTMISYNGELWLAFECAGTGPNLSGAPASSCIAPINNTTYMIDTSRLTIAVKGIPVAGSANGYSASVPKIFLFGGNPYLYWSTVRVGASPNSHIGLDVTTRGVALIQEATGAHRLWASGSVGSALPAVSSASYEVLGLGSNSISNGAADGFDVQVVGSNILLTAGIGGKGCADPGDPMYGCYRLQVRSSTTPLGTGIFNSSIVTSPTFPFNPGAYSKIFMVPGGSKAMMGAYYPPILNGSPQPSNTYGTTGFLRYATNPAAYALGSTDSTPLPVPTFAANYLSTTFPTVQRFVLQCSSSNPLPNASDGSCYSGVTRVCQNQGYENGGFLQDYAGGAGHIACVRSGKSTLHFVNISALTALHSSCTITTMISNACASAINRYCQNAGFAGGYGPLEFVNPNVQLTCVKSTVATIVLTNFTALSGQQPSCTQTNTLPSACNAATSLLCRSMGYIGGFGIVEIGGSAAQIGCIKGSVLASRVEATSEQYASTDHGSIVAGGGTLSDPRRYDISSFGS